MLSTHRLLLLRLPVLAIIIGLVIAGKVTAQTPVQVAAENDSLAVEIGTYYFDNNIKGYGKADVLGPDGKTHQVYIPITLNGFARLLPYYQREEDLRRFGNQPLNISVDKVQSIRMNALYLEHMLVGGKRKHILAARLSNGTVEVFNYTEIVDTGLMVAYPNRSWYLRRQGELVEVSRKNFIPQMTAYFQDDAELMALISAGKLHYRDVLTIGRLYNQHKASAMPAQPVAK